MFLFVSEKVTDSDVEEQVDVDDSQTTASNQPTTQQQSTTFNHSMENESSGVSAAKAGSKSAANVAVPTSSGPTTTTTPTNNNNNNSSCDPNSRARDFTCKPRAIKAQKVDTTLLNYQQIPLYAFSSPKNPTGILPFQPTGEQIDLICHIIFIHCKKKIEINDYFLLIGGAFKTMPNSPKVVKPLHGDDSTNPDYDSSTNDVVPSVFTFNTVPPMSAPSATGEFFFCAQF